MDSKVDLGINIEGMTDEDYHELWEKMGMIQIKLVEKIGKCSHEVGDTYYYEDPYHKPAGVCAVLLHVLDLYTWRVALGFPSWDSDRKAHMIHCPAKKGTVWEIRKVE